MVFDYGHILSSTIWTYFVISQLFYVNAVFNHCPHRCICNVTTLKCNNKLLKSVPEFKKLEFYPDTINLSENDIEEITEYDFTYSKLEKLKYLQINDNEIFNIQGSSFLHLTDLEFLDLSNNQLDDIPSEIIEKNAKLLELNLSNNLFGSNTPIITSTSLLVLDLSSCKLITFTENNLKAMPNLKALYMHINNFQQLDYHTFRKSNLKFLDISYNPWKCHCDTIKLFEHLLKFGITELKSNVQCLHANKLFEDIYGPKGSLGSNYCIKKVHINSKQPEKPSSKVNKEKIDNEDFQSLSNPKEQGGVVIMHFEVILITAVVSVLIVVSLITLAVVVRRTTPVQRPVYGQLPTKTTFL